MKFVLVGFGGRGDVEPCAAVGRELMRRGHDVVMAVPPNLLAFVESVGLAAVAYGPDSHAQLDQAAGFFAGQKTNPFAALTEGLERATQVWADKMAVLTPLAEGADLLLAGMMEQRLAASVAEYYDIPLVALHFFPAQIQPTGLLHSQITKLVEDPHRRALGLPEAVEPAEPPLEIQAYDELCLPGPATQWVQPGTRRPYVGALTLESATDADDEVLSWIAEGSPPIYFGFGSTPISSLATIDMVIGVCQLLGERLLICSGPNDFSGVEHGDQVKVVRAVNHAAVFPACRAVIHHGGAGTVAAAMRAGVPMLILWLWLDQPVWAAAIQQLKVGVARPFSATNQQTLITDLDSILAAHYPTRAREIAALMTKPAESVTSAADLVEDAARTV
jgi:vancomycin aglycone glucosyltransferase